ncbi:unnamed protein product [Strongylus vulgaris]|uniref:Uncharacterized protein n=1 Tax=Strongylus vulgaris TaxID=40348 RepID=A0A3P7ITG1_STRVU|nr:unnamed protein product [Strongylus vulgaris]
MTTIHHYLNPGDYRIRLIPKYPYPMDGDSQLLSIYVRSQTVKVKRRGWKESEWTSGQSDNGGTRARDAAKACC